MEIQIFLSQRNKTIHKCMTNLYAEAIRYKRFSERYNLENICNNFRGNIFFVSASNAFVSLSPVEKKIIVDDFFLH